MWDDYFGFDWYPVQQGAIFGTIGLIFLGLIGMTEGWGFFWLFEKIGNLISSNAETVLIIGIVLSMGLYQFVRYKGGY